MGFRDAHNHLQDDRFAGRQDECVALATAAGVEAMVVNGSVEGDWPLVRELARRHPAVIPAFGLHPWYLAERTVNWEETLVALLTAHPRAGVGEIGLDRWVLEQPAERLARHLPPGTRPPDFATQESIFRRQLELAAEFCRPASLHCLEAWGALLDALQRGPRLPAGFLIHSYGGPAAMVPQFARLGAYFGFPGYFLHERKARQRGTFRAVPPDRLLVETDAPDQLPPDASILHPLTDSATGRALNHPANLPAIYAGLAAFLDEPVDALTARVAANFDRLFGAG